MKQRKQFDQSKRGKIHKVDAKTTENENESTSDSDTELALHMVTAMPTKKQKRGWLLKSKMQHHL